MRQISVLLTGGIGCGKTTIAKYINEYYGIPVFYSDNEAKNLYEDYNFLTQIDKIVGGNIIGDDKKLDKKKLSEKIFTDKIKKQKVESIVHPKVIDNFKSWEKRQTSPIVIMESAIILPNRKEIFDYIIIVDTSKSIQIERVMNRNNLSKDNALNIINSQEFNHGIADFIIDNGSDFKESTDKIIQNLKKITNKKALFAGSFDPFTNGHLSILKRSCKIFDEVYVCIARNSEKIRRYPEELMKKAIEETIILEGIKNCNVIIWDGMVVDVCEKYNISYFIRGLRNEDDYKYEEIISQTNQKLNPNIETIYLRAENSKISSSMVHEKIKNKEPVDEYLPEPVHQAIINYLQNPDHQKNIN